MRDPSHKKHMDRWAAPVLQDSNWKKEHTAFINAQFAKAEAFMMLMAKEKDGVERLAVIYNIKNKRLVENFVKSVNSKSSPHSSTEFSL